jgi:hypothetical protein
VRRVRQAHKAVGQRVGQCMHRVLILGGGIHAEQTSVRVLRGERLHRHSNTNDGNRNETHGT